MRADRIDHWGEALERLNLRLSCAALGILSVAALAALILPRGSQTVIAAILERSTDYSYSMALPTANGSYAIKMRQLPLFYSEFRYQPWVMRTTGGTEKSLGSKGSWDGLRPLVIYEHGPEAIVIRMRGRGYDTYGVAAARSTRRFVGLVRMGTVQGRKRLLFVDGRAVQECDPDAGPQQVGALPACAPSPAD